MKLTIIIPTYNRVDLLRLAIRSIVRQSTSYVLDILVVDDGSTDGTACYLHDLTRRDPRVRCLRQPNAGVTAARNAGLAALLPDTDLVTFLDSDDVFAPGYLAQTEAHFAQAPALDMTYGRMLMVEDIDPVTLMPPKGARTAAMTAIQLSSAIFRRDLVDRIGGFDEALKQSEDVDYFLRIFETAPKIAQTDQLCLYYRRHTGNMTKNLQEAQRFFSLALLKSMKRRKKDPGMQIVKPRFDCENIARAEFY